MRHAEKKSDHTQSAISKIESGERTLGYVESFFFCEALGKGYEVLAQETLARLAGRMGEGSGRVTGVDHSEVACAESRELNAAEIEAGRIRVVCASVVDLPFADASFDVVTTIESFYFWPEPEKSLAEVRRVLARGGRFLLVADIYEKDDLGEEERANIERYGLTVLDPEGYRALFSAAGFASCEVHTKAGTDWICVEGVA